MRKELLCTLGPSSLNDRAITRLGELGVSLFRLNLSHTSTDDLEDLITYVQERSSVSVCLDTEGAQIRTGEFDGGSTQLRENSFVKVRRNYIVGSEKEFNFYPRSIIQELNHGDLISIDFNSVLAQVVEKRADFICLRVLNGGVVGSNKAVTVNRTIVMPALTEKDRIAIEIGIRKEISHFALSFAGSADDVQMLRSLVGVGATIISKIESRQSLQNVEEIIESSDAILIDRGDLSREIPIEHIPAMQKLVINKAKTRNAKVFVATNLLESMVKRPSPTRAEVNDIYNTLVDGASGLVLAAETAVGRYPIECAAMIGRLIEEYGKTTETWKGDTSDFNVGSELISPHGGSLVRRIAVPTEVENLDSLKAITIDGDLASDCRQIGLGGYSPVTGFMDKVTLEAVLMENKLPEGCIWPMPIVLVVPENEAKTLSVGARVVLKSNAGEALALLDVNDIYPVNFEWVTTNWFGTSSLDHPGVNRFSRMGNYFVGGPIKLIKEESTDYFHYDLSPEQSRFVFLHKGWSHVVGFHTRNVAHRAHEYILLDALEKTHADGLFVHPVVGGKKSGDFSAEPIMKSFQLLMEIGVFPNGKVVLGGFSTYSRYCGPREAMFTALCRKNMGCNYFIIGRDHTGVKNFYEADANRRYFDSVGEIGVTPVFFDTVGYDHTTGSYAEAVTAGELESISATRFREMIKEKKRAPSWFVRPEIQEMLVSEMDADHSIFHE